MYEPTPIAEQFGIKAVTEEQKQKLIESIDFVVEFLYAVGNHEAGDDAQKAVEYGWQVLYGQSLQSDGEDEDDD